MKKCLQWLEPFCLLIVPLVLLGCTLGNWQNTALLSTFALLAAMLPFFAGLEIRKLRARDICPIVVLAALAAAGRVIFAPFANVKPMTAIIVVTAACFGRESGFLTGALAALSSNLFFGQGPWTPWQMYAWGLTGYLGGVMTQAGLLRKRWQACLFGFLVCLLYGFLMDSYYVTGYVLPAEWKVILAGYAAGVPFNLIHGVSTAVFLFLIWEPWCRKLRRVRSKYDILHTF